jgi:uncharacterized protein YjiS (DUF1127 family)
MTAFTHSQPYGRSDAAGRRGSIDRLRDAWADWRLYRRTRDELAGLSDRDLADLGISRYDIDAIARSTVYGA